MFLLQRLNFLLPGKLFFFNLLFCAAQLFLIVRCYLGLDLRTLFLMCSCGRSNGQSMLGLQLFNLPAVLRIQLCDFFLAVADLSMQLLFRDLPVFPLRLNAALTFCSGYLFLFLACLFPGRFGKLLDHSRLHQTDAEVQKCFFLGIFFGVEHNLRIQLENMHI